MEFSDSISFAHLQDVVEIPRKARAEVSRRDSTDFILIAYYRRHSKTILQNTNGVETLRLVGKHGKCLAKFVAPTEEAKNVWKEVFRFAVKSHRLHEQPSS